jgi:hypothetical protein
LFILAYNSLHTKAATCIGLFVRDAEVEQSVRQQLDSPKRIVNLWVTHAKLTPLVLPLHEDLRAQRVGREGSGLETAGWAHVGLICPPEQIAERCVAVGVDTPRVAAVHEQLAHSADVVPKRTCGAECRLVVAHAPHHVNPLRPTK